MRLRNRKNILTIFVVVISGAVVLQWFDAFAALQSAPTPIFHQSIPTNDPETNLIPLQPIVVQTETTTTTTTSTSTSTSTTASSTTSTSSTSTATSSVASSSSSSFEDGLKKVKAASNASVVFSGECGARLTEAVPAVISEMLKPFSSNVSSIDCQPQNFTFSCESLSQSSLNCTQPLVVAGFDYVKQHHCLSSIAHSVSNSSNQTAKVPRILQYVWYYDSNKNFDFTFYLGMISTLRYFRPKAIFLWHDGVLPKGRWWQELLKQLHPARPNVSNEKIDLVLSGQNFSRVVHFFEQTKLYFVYRQRPTHIHGNLMTHDAHKSDIVRLEALIHYGGLYIDTDVLAVRNLDTFLQYSVTMPKEPKDAVSNSIIFAERDAPYLYLWHHTYTSFRSTEWGEHSTSGNYNLYKSCPSYLHTEHDALMKPSIDDLFVREISLTTKYLFHLYWNWEPKYAPKGTFREAKEAEEVLDWKCTMGRIMRGLLFGTCDEFCG